MCRNLFLALVEVVNVLPDIACSDAALWWSMVRQHVYIVWRQPGLCAGGGERVTEPMRKLGGRARYEMIG